MLRRVDTISSRRELWVADVHGSEVNLIVRNFCYFEYLPNFVSRWMLLFCGRTF